jgi:hypothetical protein
MRVESCSSRKQATIVWAKPRREAISRNTKPQSEDKRPASNVAVSGLAPTGDMPGRNGVACMAMGGGSGGDAHASASTPDSYAKPTASSSPIISPRTAS